jgi:hypothetical protein
LQFFCGWQFQAPFKDLSAQNLLKQKYLLEYQSRLCVIGQIATNGIKLKADRLYKRLVRGGLILGCVMLVC